MCNKEWLGSFFIESTLSCMCAEGLLFASIGVKNVLQIIWLAIKSLANSCMVFA